MDYNALVDIAADIGYRLAMCGAETYRVEESVKRILTAYKIESEVFAIPNCLIVGVKTPDGTSITRIRRIPFHGNDLDGVEQFNSLSRRICSELPDPKLLPSWIKETESCRSSYRFHLYLLGNFCAAFGFAFLFGGTLIDGLCAGICGCLAGISGWLMTRFRVNTFFSTIFNAFIIALTAYALGAAGIAHNTDTVVIGGLMLLVPGLLITNAMRDIIFGDTNSGINRIVQVFLVASAIALGTGVAWSISTGLWGMPVNPAPLNHSYIIQIIASIIGSLGFSIMFNAHGSGLPLCFLGGGLCWATFCTVLHFGGTDLMAGFCAAIVSAAYSELIARVRKRPAISYLVVSIMPMIPGAGVYYTTNYLVRGDISAFAMQGFHTLAIAGTIAVGILLVSSLVRFITVLRHHKQ